jgi:N-acetylmuramoyl-L-alanine amidase
MKFAVNAALLLAGLLPAAAQAPLSRMDRAWMFGTEYVQLDDWARANGGQARWVVPKQELKVVLPAGSLGFLVDARRVTIKGVHVWLSAPVVLRGSSAYVAAADFTSSIHPLLFPPRPAPGRQVRTIVLDPGHGGKDPGNQEGRRQEKQYTLQLAKDVRDLLTKAGFRVWLTRSFDSYITPESRPLIARQRGADLFISLHLNSADGPGGSAVKGSEVYCLTAANAYSTNDRGEQGRREWLTGNRNDARNTQLAYQIQKALVEKAGSEDRGVKRARFAVLKHAEMPAVLVEAAFMTNPGDARKVYDTAQRRSLAQAIVDGVQAYKRLTER